MSGNWNVRLALL